MTGQVRRVATYERVSSEDQRERETILTQTDELARRLDMDPDVELVQRYVDDGISGTIPLAERPAGQRLLGDAAKGLFQELWVYKLDRLGRDDIDPLIVRRELQRLGVKLVAVHENIEGDLEYSLRVAIAAEERRTFLARSAAGMARAARQGRYTGGIVPLGYRVKGKKQHAHLIPSNAKIWANWTEAGLVRHIYRRLAVDGWSCRRIANELNALGVPTHYQKDSRGVRGKRTQGIWRPGRIRNLVVNPVYKGELQYGRRSNKPASREIISARVKPLVCREIWQAAQATLTANRIKPKNGKRIYLLRGLIVCGICGLHYCGCSNRGTAWYRCDGQLVERGPIEGRCPSKSVKGPELEPTVWDDIERWLRNPGDLIDELAAERNRTAGAAVAEADRTTLQTALKNCVSQRDRMLDLYRRGRITVDELDAHLDRISEEKQTLEERLRALEPQLAPAADGLPSEDLLAEIRCRLDEGLDDERRQEIASLLVRRITIETEFLERGKRATAMVEYKFPRVVSTCTDRDSWRPPA
jgi:site-specific DNA recombinase